MGNLSSCFNTQNLLINSKNMAKLVDSLGQLKLVNLPITVADLMLENPGFALASVKELRRMHYIVAMRADEQLLAWKVYLLVPVGIVKSRLSKEQLGVINEIVMSWYVDNMMGTRARGRTSLISVSLERLMKDLGGVTSGATGQRKRNFKAWKLALEPTPYLGSVVRP